MATCVALLRGVNVGGKTLKMEALRTGLEELGFADIRTYVQSGNVVFVSPETSAARLSKKIEDRILDEFGLAVSVLVKTAKEMKQIVKENPFLKDKAIDESKLHVTFLSDIPKGPTVEKLKALQPMGNAFQTVGSQIYLYCPNGYGRTKLSNNAIEKKLSVVATTRNWRTVNTLLGMM